MSDNKVESSSYFTKEELKAQGIDPENPNPTDGKVLDGLVKARKMAESKAAQQPSNQEETQQV